MLKCLQIKKVSVHLYRYQQRSWYGKTRDYENDI